MSDFNLTPLPADGWANPAHLNTQFSSCKNGMSPAVVMETIVFSQDRIKEEHASVFTVVNGDC